MSAIWDRWGEPWPADAGWSDSSCVICSPAGYDPGPRAEPRPIADPWHRGGLRPRHVIWDNRCVLHRARPYDYSTVRVMRHTRVAGDPATELAPTHRDERAQAYEPSASNR